jgi:hypothetical protein
MRVELHIERLVLDGTGVEPRHAGAVREAVETELSRLFTGTRQRVWPSWQDRRLRRLAAPPVRLPAGHDPAAAGRVIARSVYGGLATPTIRGGGR